jgi:hypothetical protein
VGTEQARLTSAQNDDNTGTLDATEEGILDLLVTKQWAIKLATEAARTILSVDQIIVARQAGGPKPPGPNPVSLNICRYKLESTEKANQSSRTGTRTDPEDGKKILGRALRKGVLMGSRLGGRYPSHGGCTRSQKK